MKIVKIMLEDHELTNDELRKALGLSWPRYAGLRLLCWLREMLASA